MKAITKILAAIALLTMLAAPMASADAPTGFNQQDYPASCRQVYQNQVHNGDWTWDGNPVVMNQCNAAVANGTPTVPYGKGNN